MLQGVRRARDAGVDDKRNGMDGATNNHGLTDPPLIPRRQTRADERTDGRPRGYHRQDGTLQLPGKSAVREK